MGLADVGDENADVLAAPDRPQSGEYIFVHRFKNPIVSRHSNRFPLPQNILDELVLAGSSAFIADKVEHPITSTEVYSGRMRGSPQWKSSRGQRLEQLLVDTLIQQINTPAVFFRHHGQPFRCK